MCVQTITAIGENMRITAPTFTQTPNDLFDHWLPHLGEVELKVLLVIMRKTFGWHKTRDRISISQLTTLTGSIPKNVISAVRSLIEKGIVIKSVEGPIGKQVTYYEMVVHEDSNNSYPCRIDSGTPVESTGGTPVKLTVTKETSSKEKERNLSVVGAVAPTSEVPKEEPSLSKKESLEESDSLPHRAVILQKDGSKLEVSQSQLYERVIRSRCDFSSDAIRYAWNSLCNYEGVVHDWWRFIEGTAKNYSNKKKSKHIGQTTCQNNKQQNNRQQSERNTETHSSNHSREASLGSASSEQPSPQWGLVKKLVEQSRHSSRNPPTSSSSSVPQVQERPTCAAPL